MLNDKNDRRIRTMLALHVGISQTTELAARTLWNEQRFGCSVGALVPVGMRTDAGRAKLLTNRAWWKQWDKDILYMTANANNAFVGTNKERQRHMKKWTAKMYHKLVSGENIIVEGSDLMVPHFEVNEDGTASEREAVAV